MITEIPVRTWPAGAASRAARRRGEILLRYRLQLGVAFVAATLFMACWALQARFATRFDDLIPGRHPNVMLYRHFEETYGQAQTLVAMLRVEKGDIFNPATLKKVQDLTFGINRLPGVNHNEVFSLASYRVIYARAVPGALVLHTFMYPVVPKVQKEADDLRRVVMTHRAPLAGLITDDNKGALIVASFNERSLDYREAFAGAEKMREQFEDANTRIYLSGDVMILGWGYHFLPRIELIFAMSIALMLAIVYLSLGARTGWWVPIVTGSCSAIWGLGFMALAGFNLDPVMLVIPLLLTARDLGHGIQWQGRYYHELDRTPETRIAIAQAAGMMFPAGLLAVLANVAGIIFLTFSDIPVLRNIGIGGSVWLASSLVLVFVFQPIMVSWLPRPRPRRERRLIRRAIAGRFGAAESFRDWLTRIPVTPGIARSLLAAAGIVLLAAGVLCARGIPIGYQGRSIPLFRPDAVVNRDYAVISRFVPAYTGWIVVATPDYPSRQSNIGPDVLRMERDLGDYLKVRGNIAAFSGFGSVAARPMNSLLHYGSPKFLATPDDPGLIGTIWVIFSSGATSDEIEAYFAHAPSVTSSCIRVLLPDQTYGRLRRLRGDLDAFVRERVAADRRLSQVHLSYLGGDAGVVMATDEVLGRLGVVNLALAITMIVACCAIMFRSLRAGLLLALSSVAASFISSIYMHYGNIALTTYIVPILSLGLGLGVNYGIYIAFGIRDNVGNGASLSRAIVQAVCTAGGWALAGYVVLAGGMLPWIFSPLLFHHQMSVLLILMMTSNLVAGVFMLPALIAWSQPRFLTCRKQDSATLEPASSAAGS